MTDKPKHIFQDKFMKRAIELSRYGSIIKKTGGVFGAVIVKDNQIIAEGYNQVVAHKDPTWHAEMQAIREASKIMGNPHLTGCVMYSSNECCPMCLSASYWAHLDEIYYGATTKDALQYGNFADCDILAELKKDPDDMQLKSSQHMRDEALEVWKEYAQMTDRVHY
jgi:guanine deaminase